MRSLKIGHVLLNPDRIEAVVSYPANHEVMIRTYSGALFTFHGKDADAALAIFEPGPEVVANAGDENHDPQFAAA